MGLVIAGKRVRSTQASVREAIVSVQRAIEDASWTNLSTDARDPTERDYDQRRSIIIRSREMLKRSPLAKTAANLLVNYVLGQGVSITAANKSRVAPLIDQFWNDPVNQMSLTGASAQANVLETAFTDGSYYAVLFPDRDEGMLQVGFLDALYVDDIIMDRENSLIPRYYKVRLPKGEFDFKQGTWTATAADEFVYYRHWRNVGEEGEGAAVPWGPEKVQQGLVYQFKRGKGRFGQPELFAALDWLKAHKEFMEDRATLTRAAASLAWRKKRKGGVADVNAQVEALRSSLTKAAQGGSYGYESNPPPATASTIIENEASTTEWIKTDTGGQAALADERILRMMAGSGMGGVPNHYFGDEANANLATATSMELPLLKNYERWQSWFGGGLRDILKYSLEIAHEAGNLGPEDVSSHYRDRQLSIERVIDQDAQQQQQQAMAQLPPGTPPSGGNFGAPRPAIPGGPGRPRLAGGGP